jgi:type 1 glutamine amidotransferase
MSEAAVHFPLRRVGALVFGTAALWVALAAPSPSAAEEEAGFRPIFDGVSLAGWDGNPKLWRVEDGTITGQTTPDNPTQGNTFLIWRQGELDDFELKLDYRIVGGNSGVQYRSWEDPEQWGRWVVGGYQADIEAGDTWSGALYGEKYRGVLAARGEQTIVGNDHKPKVVGNVGDSNELQSIIKKEDWNAYHIVVRGSHMVHKINGRVTAEATDEDESMRRRSGILALQLHAGPPMKAQFRNVRLKRLPMEDQKKVVFLAGTPSHGYGAHEHRAGSLILAGALNQNVPGVHAVVYDNGWPSDPTALDNADAIVLYCDGADGHPVNRHLDEVDALLKRGVGLACFHFGVEVPKGPSGDAFLDWIGGYFELFWSVNPHWTANFAALPDHPITRGVEPFTINDEWYYHMRFREGMDGITPILTAVPPETTRQGKDGGRSGNPAVRERTGMPEHVAWARQRPDGGRGFGFTGGHVHWNWGNDQFRKLALNALVWVAGAEVPPDGVPSSPLSIEDLEANQDYPPPADFDRERIVDLLASWRR